MLCRCFSSWLCVQWNVAVLVFRAAPRSTVCLLHQLTHPHPGLAQFDSCNLKMRERSPLSCFTSSFHCTSWTHPGSNAHHKLPNCHLYLVWCRWSPTLSSLWSSSCSVSPLHFMFTTFNPVLSVLSPCLQCFPFTYLFLLKIEEFWFATVPSVTLSSRVTQDQPAPGSTQKAATAAGWSWVTHLYCTVCQGSKPSKLLFIHHDTEQQWHPHIWVAEGSQYSAFNK